MRRHVWLLSSVLLVTACMEAGDDLAIGSSQQEVLSQNALTQNAMTQNAMTQNAMTQNAMTQNAMTQNAMTQNAMTQNAMTQNALKDPLFREALQFIVACALPDGQSLDLTVEGVDYSFPGHIGLAPEWGEEGGSCDRDCQRWVSACVISHVNAHGEHVWISIRGAHEALATTKKERREFSEGEGAYYGNLFVTPLEIMACVAPGADGLPRVCDDNPDCAIIPVGECDEVCDKTLSDGAYKDCEDFGGAERDEVVTVFLRP